MAATYHDDDDDDDEALLAVIDNAIHEYDTMGDPALAAMLGRDAAGGGKSQVSKPGALGNGITGASRNAKFMYYFMPILKVAFFPAAGNGTPRGKLPRSLPITNAVPPSTGLPQDAAQDTKTAKDTQAEGPRKICQRSTGWY